MKLQFNNNEIIGGISQMSNRSSFIMSSCVAVPAAAPLVRDEEGVLRDPVDAVEGGEDEREDGDANKVQQLKPPLQPLGLKVKMAIE